MSRRRQFTDEELRERRNQQWYESRCRCGHVGVCPLCGGYTRSASGYHPSCAKKAGLGAAALRGENRRTTGGRQRLADAFASNAETAGEEGKREGMAPGGMHGKVMHGITCGKRCEKERGGNGNGNVKSISVSAPWLRFVGAFVLPERRDSVRRKLYAVQ